LYCCVGGLFALVTGSAFAQGTLTPPGVPVPTMKSLDQVASTGVALNTTNAPGDANNHFIINQAGSYFLSGNLGVTKTNGIRVNVAGVTIDLNGFEISRSSGSGGDAITIRPEGHRCAVKNGSLTGFANGIDCITTTAQGCVFRNLAAANCTNIAIRAGEGATLESCRVHDNSGVAGILTSTGATLRNCSAVGNSATNGIQAGAGSTLINCVAASNTGTNGISVGDGTSLTNCAASGNTLIGSGIVTGEACPLNNCVAYANQLTEPSSTPLYGIKAGVGSSLLNCSASSNTTVQYGIFVGNGGSLTNTATYSNLASFATAGSFAAGTGTGSGCVVTSSVSGSNSGGISFHSSTEGAGYLLGGSTTLQYSTARSNTGRGIILTGGNVVRSNSAVGNGSQVVFPDGISGNSPGGQNRIEGNNVTDNQTHEYDTDGHTILLNNSLSGEIYSIAAGNSFGVIVDDSGGGAAVNGNSAAASFGSPNAWANFTY
jgi:hypothetical protein